MDPGPGGLSLLLVSLLRTPAQPLLSEAQASSGVWARGWDRYVRSPSRLWIPCEH